MSNLPMIDEKYTSSIFNTLSDMDVPLDEDPLSFGPKRLNGKVALCRTHLDRCQRLFLQVSNDLHTLNRRLRSMKVEFDLRLQDMFANDPETRAGRNVRDREAIATMKLRDFREEMATIESSIQDLDSVISVVKAKRDDLRDVQGRIRDQLKLCQEELSLGARWGSRSGPGMPTPHLASAPKVDAALLATFNSIPGGSEEPGLDDLDQFTQMVLGVRLDPEFKIESPFLKNSALADEVVASSKQTIPSAALSENEIVLESEMIPVEEENLVKVSPPPVQLPEVRETSVPLQQPSSTDLQFDSILNDMDKTPSQSTKSAPNSAHVSEIDLDDLLSSF